MGDAEISQRIVLKTKRKRDKFPELVQRGARAEREGLRRMTYCTLWISSTCWEMGGVPCCASATSPTSSRPFNLFTSATTSSICLFSTHRMVMNMTQVHWVNARKQKGLREDAASLRRRQRENGERWWVAAGEAPCLLRNRAVWLGYWLPQTSNARSQSFSGKGSLSKSPPPTLL